MSKITQKINEMDDVIKKLAELRSLVDQVKSAIQDPNLTKEVDYLEHVTPKLEAATDIYQGIAAFLQSHKTNPTHEFRSTQRQFVKIMHELQKVQHDSVKRREELVDSDIMAISKITAQEIQQAKEEVLDAEQIALEALTVKELFQQVGTMIHDQSENIQTIEQNISSVRIQIGKGIDELEHARTLQREARKKYLIFFLVIVFLLLAIIVPILILFKII